MAPLDATSCWVLGQTASQQRRSFCHLQVVGGGTRHQPSVGHHKRWRVSIPVIHWFVQVCRGWERVLAQRIPFIFDFAMYIEIKDEISHSVQRFSVKCGCVWHLFSEVPLLLRAVSAGGEVAVMSWLLVTKLRTCGKLSTLIIWTLHYKQTMYMAPSHCVLCTAQSFVCIYRQMTYQPLCSSGTAPLED